MKSSLEYETLYIDEIIFVGVPHDLQPGADERTGGHVVDEEGPVVGQEDALPVDARVRALQ